MGGDDYLGTIDWDCIYREFHTPLAIAQRIEDELKNMDGKILFAGFSDVAEYLAQKRELRFVDASHVVIEKVRQKKGHITDTVVGNVCEQLADFLNIVVVCRISAFWKTSQAFTTLIQSILASPRQTVLIDFYDAHMVNEKTDIHFATAKSKGRWKVTALHKSTGDIPSNIHADIDVSYSMSDMNVAYPAQRAFFERSAIEKYFRESLKNYWVEIKKGIIKDDPSFLMKLTPKETLF